MVLLIDANVLLDVLQKREPYYADSSTIWKLCETEQVKGVISPLTFANLVYIMRKELAPESIRDVLRKMALIFDFAELSKSDLLRAAEMCWADFEDALQSVTAERIHAHYILTRNIRDFRQSKVMALTPAEFLARF